MKKQKNPKLWTHTTKYLLLKKEKLNLKISLVDQNSIFIIFHFTKFFHFLGVLGFWGRCLDSSPLSQSKNPLGHFRRELGWLSFDWFDLWMGSWSLVFRTSSSLFCHHRVSWGVYYFFGLWYRDSAPLSQGGWPAGLGLYRRECSWWLTSGLGWNANLHSFLQLIIFSSTINRGPAG